MLNLNIQDRSITTFQNKKSTLTNYKTAIPASYKFKQNKE